MCGIVGYVGHNGATPVLLGGLRRLEYRGYDSAGLSVQEGKSVLTLRAVGKVARLADKVRAEWSDERQAKCSVGIAHTRWATHGAPTEANAHPHADASGRIRLVHNGIIENYRVIRAKLEAKGHVFTSETDTEAVSRLIGEYYKGDLRKAVINALRQVEGAYGIAVISADEPGRIVVARKGSPLVIGVGEGECLVASDPSALIAHTRRVIYLDDGDVALVTADSVDITDLDHAPMDAGMVGDFAFEDLAAIQAEVQPAAEFRYRNPLVDGRDLVVAISQSGETADTLAAVREAKDKGAMVMGLVNVVGSTIAREAGRGVYLHAGPEISVASTKAFTSQVAILLLMALKLGRGRRLSRERGLALAAEIGRLPELIEAVLRQDAAIAKVAESMAKHEHAFFLGRGPMHPVALEGALKLKEISYIHAEGYHAAELKHGPIALLTLGMPVVVLANRSPVVDKTLGNAEECKARGAHVIAIVTEGGPEAAIADEVIRIPDCDPLVATIPAAVALQLLSYHVARLRGCPIDQPRNLAKSVTVE